LGSGADFASIVFCQIPAWQYAPQRNKSPGGFSTVAPNSLAVAGSILNPPYANSFKCVTPRFTEVLPESAVPASAPVSDMAIAATTPPRASRALNELVAT